MSAFLETIQKTREYLDYLEKHYGFVQHAFLIVSKALDLDRDGAVYQELRDQVSCHDMSKLSDKEFVQYRRKFFPTSADKELEMVVNNGFELAWIHHKKSNHHHFESIKFDGQDVKSQVNGLHMICDWVAMSLSFGEKSPRGYFEKNKHKMFIPFWMTSSVYTVCDFMEKMKG
jgi:hypothetical protein